MPTVLYPAPLFGPVHSRRLGHSLGINLLPADGKVCSFDCVYCECGLNAAHRPRLAMSSPECVAEALRTRLEAMQQRGEPLDAITFAGNGEPTSHPQFARIVDEVMALRDRYCPQAAVCVLTNATHLDRPDVMAALLRLDKACLKLDAVIPEYIQRVDRPNCRYDLASVLTAMQSFGGRCIIQTLFMKGTWEGVSVDNTGPEYVQPWLRALQSIRPAGVDIYTLARDTPSPTLLKVPAEELEAIAEAVRALGIDAHSYG